MADPHRVTDPAQLDALYRPPMERAANKVQDRIDGASARFIDRCRLAVVATVSASGRADASPRGGPAGFAARLGDRHVALPDLVGNNRLDSLRNVLETGRAGLLLIVPGSETTIRVNGPAHLTTDPDVLSRFPPSLRPPVLALVVETEELLAHCTKPFRRGGVWDPASWEEGAGAPDLAEIYAAQFASFDAEAMRPQLDALFDEHLRGERADGGTAAAP